MLNIMMKGGERGNGSRYVPVNVTLVWKICIDCFHFNWGIRVWNCFCELEVENA